ncbi:MAG: lipopolysaccharide heptosyltransferase II [Gammaproteobacteria bacterium]|nr:lipopolysaccharide heptosyltransferase II [Gammaproteobacteria bacterium]
MKILVVGPSWVGDSVMAQTLYKRIKKELPSSQIDVISPHWSLALLERMPEVCKKIVSPFSHGETKLLERYRLGQGLKKENYDRAIVLTNSLKSSLIPYFARIGVRTGWLGEFRYGLINDIRSSKKLKKSLMIEKFAALSLYEENYSIENLTFPELEIDFANQRKFLEEFSIDYSKNTMAICPGAEFGPSKRWPAEYYAEIAIFYVNKGWNVLCIGSKNDEDIGIEIGSFNNLGCNESFINLIGKTSLQDAIDILAFTEKVVTNDSGLMHIAAAVKTPLVALYGPSSPEYTPPLISKKKILRKTQGYEKVRYGSNEKGYHQSLLDIKPEEVLNALEEL